MNCNYIMLLLLSLVISVQSAPFFPGEPTNNMDFDTLKEMLIEEIDNPFSFDDYAKSSGMGSNISADGDTKSSSTDTSSTDKEGLPEADFKGRDASNVNVKRQVVLDSHQTVKGNFVCNGATLLKGISILGNGVEVQTENPYNDIVGLPSAIISRLSVGGVPGNVAAILQMYHHGTGSAEFYKPSGQSLILRETPGATTKGSWFNNFEVQADMHVSGKMYVSNHDGTEKLYLNKELSDHSRLINESNDKIDKLTTEVHSLKIALAALLKANQN